jgi:antitoxin component of RelBE/YafQ-DinJ toxin-antitoxin module
MASDVISVRVNRKIREEAARLGVDVREVVENALEAAVSQKKQARLLEVVEQLKKEMDGVTEEQWVQAIRNSRKRRMQIQHS